MYSFGLNPNAFIIIYFFTENTALEITLATNVSFIVCTAPLLTTILSLWIYKKEKATRGLMAGSLLALVGVALVVYNGSFVLKISPLGDFLTLLAAFSWAFYSLIMRKMSNRYSIIFITRKIFFYGVLTILPAFLVHPWQFDITRLLEPAILFNLLFLGVLASLICFVVWNVVLKQLGTIRASNYIYLNPLFTLIGSAFLLGERLTMVALMGAALILGGVYWAGKNVLEDLLLQLRERDVRIIPLDINCFIRELKSGISFLIQGAMVGIHEDGQLVRIVLYFRNVLEERTQKHLLNIALSRTQIFQWSFDMEHNLMIIEPRYFEYLGIPTRDYTLTPEEFAFLIHPDDRKGVFDALALQLHGNLYERPVEYRLRRGDGKWEWFEAQSTYVGQLTDLPFRIIGICMSTQKYKDTENKLNEALQKAQRSDELKSVFLANMSHEIRTPLNAIVGFSTLLACGDADLSRQEIMEFTSLIEKNSQLLMVLISDILDLSKIESNTMEFHFEKVSLNGILESIYSAQKMNLRKGVELLLDLPDRAAVIYTDPTRLGQVVNNLINNAVKFTAEGRITIGYRLKDFATLEVFVEDTGTGMSEEVLAHIFERFYKGDAFVQGTGLGLAICRTIVERFHGKIEVASTLGKGSRFAIVLPQEMRE